ncbi:hypothetical protein MFU01_05500 [Myxococcus fulvus]|uniref:Uncharacterized protein n=1 Tax=Myxococcus fulvus TaxID=33 RepID=A0A511SW03_MYXFU|nr:hypothetical protein MFU01_05500 [Myxococcus fulvus]
MTDPGAGGAALEAAVALVAGVGALGVAGLFAGPAVADLGVGAGWEAVATALFALGPDALGLLWGLDDSTCLSVRAWGGLALGAQDASTGGCSLFVLDAVLAFGADALLA